MTAARRFGAATALAFSLLAAACGGAAGGRGAARQAPGHRIVALVPSLAEDLFAIGAGGDVVAVSAFTDEPGAKRLPRVADFTSIDTERIVALNPDVAIGIPSQARLVEPLRRAGVRVVLVPDDSYADIFTDIRTAGDLSGRPRAAAALIARLQAQTARLHAQTRRFRRHPSVFVVLGNDPIWTAGSGSYIATLIALAGGTNAAGDMHAAYGEYSAEALVRDRPDAIVTDPAIHLGAALGRQPWVGLTAVLEKRVYTVIPASMVERPGPHYNDGIRWLLERLTPLAARS